MAARTGRSKNELLDAAEELFATEGFDATTTRAIAERAGSTLGTLAHHFQSKDHLFKEVLSRRFLCLDRMRQQLHDQKLAEAKGTRVSLMAMVEAIVIPYIDSVFRSNQGWRSYALLMGRVVRTNDVRHRSHVMDLRRTHTERYRGWLKEAMPDAPDIEIHYAYDMMITAMVGACAEVESDRQFVCGGLDSEENFSYVAPRIIHFITNGIVGMLSVGVEEPD